MSPWKSQHKKSALQSVHTRCFVNRNSKTIRAIHNFSTLFWQYLQGQQKTVQTKVSESHSFFTNTSAVHFRPYSQNISSQSHAISYPSNFLYNIITRWKEGKKLERTLLMLTFSTETINFRFHSIVIKKNI